MVSRGSRHVGALVPSFSPGLFHPGARLTQSTCFLDHNIQWSLVLQSSWQQGTGEPISRVARNTRRHSAMVPRRLGSKDDPPPGRPGVGGPDSIFVPWRQGEMKGPSCQGRRVARLTGVPGSLETSCPKIRMSPWNIGGMVLMWPGSHREPGPTIPWKPWLRGDQGFKVSQAPGAHPGLNPRFCHDPGCWWSLLPAVQGRPETWNTTVLQAPWFQAAGRASLPRSQVAINLRNEPENVRGGPL